MSIISVTNVVVGRNPAQLKDPFEFEISFECLESLDSDLEWRIVYVGDPEDKTEDQELDCIALGPIERGALKFTFVADAPDFTKIKKENIDGITIVLLTASYKSQEFVRVGWYVHNHFVSPEDLENPPDIDDLSIEQMLSRMQRSIIADAPRVTRFQIEWDEVPEQQWVNEEKWVDQAPTQDQVSTTVGMTDDDEIPKEETVVNSDTVQQNNSL